MSGLHNPKHCQNFALLLRNIYGFFCLPRAMGLGGMELRVQFTPNTVLGEVYSPLSRGTIEVYHFFFWGSSNQQLKIFLKPQAHLFIWRKLNCFVPDEQIPRPRHSTRVTQKLVYFRRFWVKEAPSPGNIFRPRVLPLLY